MIAQVGDEGAMAVSFSGTGAYLAGVLFYFVVKSSTDCTIFQLPLL